MQELHTAPCRLYFVFVVPLAPGYFNKVQRNKIFIRNRHVIPAC